MARPVSAWYPHAIASVSEGFCPEHRTSLDRADGWCARCEKWWSLDDDVVVQKFPVKTLEGTTPGREHDPCGP
jgi:hypothetical protein